jgi:2-polyprenyl-3-methyl-5-hydroxy-6-metoxy-1,4-benzoquinol methylase
MTDLGESSEIRSRAYGTCILCRSGGSEIYLNQTDRLFGASGSWNFKKCSNDGCQLIWLDPMPLPEDIGNAYTRYYTHSTGPLGTTPNMGKRVYRQLKREYISSKYGYQLGSGTLIGRALAKLLCFFPIRRGEVDAEVRFLRSAPQGRLLDVGCGSGEWLTFMRGLGWRVEGVDFDARAVEAAKRRGLSVNYGALEQQNFKSNSFDAVTLNHVIEHVPDPIQTLTECARVLNDDGKLVISTPNTASLGHRVFKQHWRGLEPPRHLHIFSMESLTRLLQRVGFRTVLIYPHIASSVIYESFLLWRGCTETFPSERRDRTARIFTWFFNLTELFLVTVKPSIADCVTAIAVKD